MKRLVCKKESEDKDIVVYRYTDLLRAEKLEGSFQIAKTDRSVSTVKLPSYTKERIDEMQLAGKLIIASLDGGTWLEEATLSIP
ncbi:MAG: hypothetical protein HFH56_07075 [Lachnospiraceae bacterium]|jgi:hypothetical protein|nr:hypothetical protein [Lachnospiraceae bacterium]MCI9389207.1 hypothetical protein [Lachnospiraceae bacterium]MCI9470958.1 hypothetical protein [Lachnospiraceae bacterium]